MRWRGRARAWCFGGLCVVLLPAACAGKSQTRGDDAGDGGGSGDAATAGGETSGATTSSGGTPVGGAPAFGGSSGAGAAGGIAGAAAQGGTGGIAGVAGTGGANDGGLAGEGGASGDAGSAADSGAGPGSAGEAGAPGCAGSCACEGWRADCDLAPGCETPLDGPENCGTCGVPATLYEHTRMVCTSTGGSYPICERGFGDCNLDQLDCETSFDAGGPTCLPLYLGSLEFDPLIGIAAMGLGPSGEIYLTGTFTGRVDFDPGPSSDFISMESYNSAYVTKLAADGSYVWTRAFGGTGMASVWGIDIAVGPDGSVLLLGTLQGDADLDPSDASDVHVSLSTAFAVALSPDGDYRFGRSFDSPDNRTWGARGSIAESGEIYVLKGRANALELENALSGIPDVVLTKLDSAGATLWSRASRSELGVVPAGVVATSAGAAVAFGLEGSSTLEGFLGQLSSQNPTRPAGVLARFDANGAGTDVGFLEGEDRRSLANVYRLRRVGDDGLLLAGQLHGKTDLDPGPGIASRGLAADALATFVARLDEAAGLLWAQTVPNFGFEDVAASPDGSVFLNGYGTDGAGAEILAMAPDSRSRFTLAYPTNTSIGPLAANAQQLVVVGSASAGDDIDPSRGVDVATHARVFVTRFALNAD